MIFTQDFPLTILPPAGTKRLLTPADIVYVGSFTPPLGQDGVTNFPGFTWCAVNAVGFNPAGNGGKGSLFMSGNVNWGSKVAEITIPTPAIGTGTPPAAKYLQPFGDLSGGALATAFPDPPPATTFRPPRLGSILPYNGLLYWTAWGYYNANYVQFPMFGVSSMNTQAPNFQGLYTLATNLPHGQSDNQAKSGWICGIPAEWQARFNGYSHYCGLATGPISTCSSNGAPIYAFNLKDVGPTPAPNTKYLKYDPGNYASSWAHYDYDVTQCPNPVPLLSKPRTDFFANSDYFSCFVDTGSVYGILVCENDGASGFPWYGNASGTVEGPPCAAWSDPCSTARGTHTLHGFPAAWLIYDPAIVSANVNNGLAPYVYGGIGQPQQPQHAVIGGPGATPNQWLQNSCLTINGGCYDPATGTIYIVQSEGYKPGSNPYPLIHVYRVPL